MYKNRKNAKNYKTNFVLNHKIVIFATKCPITRNNNTTIFDSISFGTKKKIILLAIKNKCTMFLGLTEKENNICKFQFVNRNSAISVDNIKKKVIEIIFGSLWLR